MCSVQAKLKGLEASSAAQTAQICTLREELQGSLAELDQVILLPPCSLHMPGGIPLHHTAVSRYLLTTSGCASHARVANAQPYLSCAVVKRC